eukprot:g12870.t1
MKTGGGGGTSKLVRKKDAKPARGISSASAGSVDANKRRKTTRGGLLKAAPNGTVPGYTEKEEGKFTGGFHFFQMADTQLGLSESLGPKHIPPEKLWKMELDMVTSAVKSINRLKPAFVVLCGDMVDAWPSEKNSTISSADEHAPPAGTGDEDGHDEESRNSRKRRFQTATLKEALGKIDQQIPLVCTCGNHDMGNRPNFHSVKQYREEWGYDFYSFWVKGVYCLVLNSQLIKDSTLVPEERKKHEFWFAKEIAGLRRVTVEQAAGKAAEADGGFCLLSLPPT